MDKTDGLRPGGTDMEEFQGEHAELTKRIIGIFFEVANELGTGFLEVIYRRSLLIALRREGFKAEEEIPMPVYFRGELVGTFFADIVVNELVVLELKVANQILDAFEAQVLHYLRSSKIQIGYVLAFGQPPKFRRLYMSNDRKRSFPAEGHPV